MWLLAPTHVTKNDNAKRKRGVMAGPTGLTFGRAALGRKGPLRSRNLYFGRAHSRKPWGRLAAVRLITYLAVDRVALLATEVGPSPRSGSVEPKRELTGLAAFKFPVRQSRI